MTILTSVPGVVAVAADASGEVGSPAGTSIQVASVHTPWSEQVCPGLRQDYNFPAIIAVIFGGNGIAGRAAVGIWIEKARPVTIAGRPLRRPRHTIRERVPMVDTAEQPDVSTSALRRSGWRRLTVNAGSLASLAVGGVALHLTDIEGGVVAMAFAVSTWLVAGGKDRTGAIGLALVSGITIYFMATAAFTNLEGWAGAEGVLISTGLSALSIMAFLATIGFSIHRDRPTGHGRWLVVGPALVVLLVPLLSGALSREQPVRDADLVVVAENVAFDQQVLSTAPGSTTVSLENRDLFWHTFTIEELGVDLRVPVSAEMTVTFDAPSGEYRFFCDIPGHPEAGMEGTLLVEG